MTRMDPAIREQWVSRLLDGRLQGQSYLDYESPSDGSRRQCCLGVLCELAEEAGVVISTVGDEGQRRYISTADRDDSNVFYLPDAVVAWAGLSDPMGTYTPHRSRSLENLGRDNDSGLKFPQIANLIREYF